MHRCRTPTGYAGSDVVSFARGRLKLPEAQAEATGSQLKVRHTQGFARGWNLVATLPIFPPPFFFVPKGATTYVV